MKYLISTLFILFFLSGCEQKKKVIEVVPNLDAIYLPANEVDVPANGGKDFKTKMENDLLSAVKSLNYSHSGFTVDFPVSLRLYINENGNIDKIKDLSPTKTKTPIPDSVQIYPHKEKLDKAIASKLVGWKFEPAKRNGENVKYRTDLAFNTIESSDGTYKNTIIIFLDNIRSAENKFFHSGKSRAREHSQPLSSDNTFGSENTFFVSVEQMPEPIGGIAGIQKRIRYPEIAKRAGIEGRVFVLAFIDAKGNVVKARIIKGIGAGCDEAALKAVEKTKFTPGRQRGKAVNVQVTVPILFKLN
jgi:TonB family protein